MGWKKANVDDVKAGRDETRSGPPFFKPEPGKNGKKKTTWIRILPPRDDSPSERWYLWVRIHFGVGSNNRQLQCLQQYDQFCPICEDVKRLKDEGDDKEADNLRSKYRALMNVVEYDDKLNIVDNKILVWSVSTDLLKDLVNEADDDDISDVMHGRDVGVTRKGSGFKDTRYTLALEDPSQFNGGDDSLLGDGLYDLSEVYTKMEAPRLVKLLTSGRPDPWADDDAVEGEVRELPEKTTAPDRASRRVAQSKAEAEAEAEPEVEPETEAEAEAPRRGWKGGGRAAAPTGDSEKDRQRRLQQAFQEEEEVDPDDPEDDSGE